MNHDRIRREAARIAREQKFDVAPELIEEAFRAAITATTTCPVAPPGLPEPLWERILDRSVGIRRQLRGAVAATVDPELTREEFHAAAAEAGLDLDDARGDLDGWIGELPAPAPAAEQEPAPEDAALERARSKAREAREAKED